MCVRERDREREMNSNKKRERGREREKRVQYDSCCFIPMSHVVDTFFTFVIFSRLETEQDLCSW